MIKIRQVIPADREILKRFVLNMIGDINSEEVATEVVEDFYNLEQNYVLVAKFANQDPISWFANF